MNKALAKLMIGFRHFREKFFTESAHSVYQKLVSDGQSPKTLLIGCSDSRVDPAILTGASPGEIFVVRNVANLVPPCEPSTTGFHGTSSALEFAVVNLKVENVIVLGHRHCGGIRALMSGATVQPESFVGQWMTIANGARERVLLKCVDDEHSFDGQCRMAEMESIKDSIHNLRSFPFVQEAIASRQMTLLGIFFDMDLGQLWELDLESNEFREVTF